MTENLIVPEGSIDDWLQELKPYQKNTLYVFLENNSYEESAKKWIANTGLPNISHFGGTKNTTPFWEKFINEFNQFICNEKLYQKEKAELVKQSQVSKQLMIAVISGVLAAKLNIAASLLAPAVAALLCSVGTVSLNAYCSSINLGDKNF